MPKVSIVMLYHEPKNEAYVDLAVESIRRQDVEKQLIVVDTSESNKKFPDWVQVIQGTHDTNSAIAANVGVKQTDADAKYLFFCNDDVVLGKDSLLELVNTMEAVEIPCIMNGFSNTDVGMYYHCPIVINDKLFPRQFPITSTTVEDQEFMMNEPPSGRPILVNAPFVCFYGTMMHRKTWIDLGGLDEFYASGPDDRDFCMRAAQKGIPSFINLRPVIWHFGGQTIATKDPEAVAANRIKNAEYFEKKFGISQ